MRGAKLCRRMPTSSKYIVFSKVGPEAVPVVFVIRLLLESLAFESGLSRLLLVILGLLAQARSARLRPVWSPLL